MSHRGELIERSIVIPLMLTERPHTRQELARTFDVDPKTIDRIMAELSRHYPILSERDGRETIYKFGDGRKYEPPPFSPSELATLLLAQESIAATGLTALHSPFAGHARKLIAKVRASLPASIREKLDAMAGILGSAAAPAKDFAPHAETVEILTTAAIECRCVRLCYHSLSSDETKDRDVDPYAVYFDPDGATLKLVGFDHEGHRPTVFSVDRIRSISETDERFTRPPDFDLREYLAENCFNGIHGEPITVRLRAYGVTARIFAERKFHRTHDIIEQTPRTDHREETTTIQMRVAGGRGLVRFILSWAPDVEVLSPPELHDEVVETHRRALSRLSHEKNFGV
jgi:predicted DNA-binding transcriptional regulator YafY